MKKQSTFDMMQGYTGYRATKFMSRYLDPKADIVFKKIFADHPHLLISFLNAVLPLAANSPIVELSYLPTEQVPIIPEFKRTIADVKCKDVKRGVDIDTVMEDTGLTREAVEQIKKSLDHPIV